MNFSQLRYILTLDKYRNFNRAAEVCGVSQSTLSKEIQRLEKEFKILIFDRSKHPVTPTMKGIDLINQAKKILEEEEKFIAIAQKRNNHPTGIFRLGVTPMLAPYLIPLFIQKLGKRYPELNIDIQELPPKEMLHQFEDDALDGGLAISPFLKEGYYEEPIFDESFVLYINPSHPLFQKKKVQWSEIPLEDLILQESVKNNLLNTEELEEEKKLNLPGNINYESGSLETLRKVIDRNGGLTILPLLSCLYMGERRIRMVRPIINPSIKRTVVLITPRGFEKNRITKAIKKEILEALPDDTFNLSFSIWN